MPRRSYTDEDKARVYAYLTSNDGNVHRTAKAVGFPEQTIRNWKDEWEQDGLPVKVEAVLPAVQGDLTVKFENVRDEALERIRALIPLATPAHLGSLNNIANQMQDKIDRLNGKPNRRVEIEHTVTHKSTEEQAALLQALANTTLDAFDDRREIIDAEIVEQPLGIPAPLNKE